MLQYSQKFVTILIIICVLFAISSQFVADIEYIRRVSIPSSVDSGWIVGENTEISLGKVSYNGNSVVSFSSTTNSISAKYPFSVDWAAFDDEVDDFVLLLNIYINDIIHLTSGSGMLFDGNISLYGENGAFLWKIKDLPLKKGWNFVTLSIRTADLIIFDNTVDENAGDTENSESSESEESEEAAETENQNFEETPIPSKKEIFLSVNGFSFDFIKRAQNELVVAFFDIEAAVPTEAHVAPPIEPLTDKEVGETLKISLIISSVLILVLIVFCIFSTRKEIKRLKREARRAKIKERRGND